MTTTYDASVIKLKPKRKRRTKDEMAELQAAIFESLSADNPQTVRQNFYQMANVYQLVEKSQSGYNTVQRLMVKMRKNKILPYEWVSDGTRWMRKPTTYDSMTEALEDTILTYRRSVWTDQHVHIEFWEEKDALAGVIYEETRKWDIPLYVSRGFSSDSYLWEAAQQLAAQNKPCFVYILTDYDEQGLHIARTIEKGLREHAPDADITVMRIALTKEQIREWNLPTRPAKDSSVKKGFDAEAVDLDAIPAWQLRQLVREKIESHIDADRYRRLLAEEKLERETLKRILNAVKGVADSDEDA